MPKKKTAAGKKTTSKKKAEKPSKADFVRSQPSDMPAKEVIAKAKAVGITLTEDAVYKTRSLDKKRAKKKPAIGKTAPSKGSNQKGRSPDKKQRILDLVAQHPDWSAQQVATAAKSSTAHVYSVWRTEPKASEEKPPRTSSNGAVTEFYRALKQLGVAKARDLIAHYETIQNA